MSERLFDTNYDDWKPGDWIVWEEDKDGPAFQITHLDGYGRVYWLEDGTEAMTRATNMLRIQGLGK